MSDIFNIDINSRSIQSTPNSSFSKLSLPSLKRRFSGSQFLSKAKNKTKSFVQDVLDKRPNSPIKNQHKVNDKLMSMPTLSLMNDFKDQHTLPINIPIRNKSEVFDQTTLDKHNFHLYGQHSLKVFRRLSGKYKENENNREFESSKSEESFSSTTDTVSSSNLEYRHTLAAAAEADILSGSERPGSFALACEFRIANENKNYEFHETFKTVPETDLLIENYKCAIQKDILLQGQLYVSEHYVCFKSNIFGYITNIVINFSEIIKVEKKMTAKFIPNSILIATKTSTHIFTSFISRDQAYDHIIKIWNLSKRIGSAKLINSTDNIDKKHPIETNTIQLKHHTLPIISNISYSSPSIPYQIKKNQFNISSSTKPHIKIRNNIYHCPCIENNNQPLSHLALDETFNSNVETMSKLLFHNSFIKHFLERYDNFKDIETTLWNKGYRQTIGKQELKCLTTGTKSINILLEDKIVGKKLPYYYCVSSKKTMPDLQINSVYSIQTRTCITRIKKDKVRLLVSFEIIFKKSGLVNSNIEKNAVDDQFRLYSHLHSVLKSPKLMRELIKDQSILQELNLIEHTSSKLFLVPRKLKDRILNYTFKGSHLVYIGFFVITITHCALAIRLHHITHSLDQIQQQNIENHDHKWYNDDIDTFQKRISILKDKIKDIDFLDLKPSDLSD